MKNGVINPWDGELTFIGKVLGELPVDVHLGKLLVLGYVFGCLEECLVISKCYLKPLYPWSPVTAHLHNYVVLEPLETFMSFKDSFDIQLKCAAGRLFKSCLNDHESAKQVGEKWKTHSWRIVEWKFQWKFATHLHFIPSNPTIIPCIFPKNFSQASEA